MTSDVDRFKRFFHGMLKRVFISRRRLRAGSFGAHSAADIDATIAAADGSSRTWLNVRASPGSWDDRASPVWSRVDRLSCLRADVDFRRLGVFIASRAASPCWLVVELVWLCRHLNLRQKRDFGYGLPRRRFLRQSLGWGVAGMATAGVGAGFLLSTHLRIMDPAFVPRPPGFAAFSS